MAVMSHRSQVLSLYRRILHLGNNWVAKDPSSTTAERNYIRDEAKSLFRKNKNVIDVKVIQENIREAEARVEIALHYQNPYPRPANVPPKTLARKQDRGLAASLGDGERLKKLR